jgi:hypothetical protein
VLGRVKGPPAFAGVFALDPPSARRPTENVGTQGVPFSFVRLRLRRIERRAGIKESSDQRRRGT